MGYVDIHDARCQPSARSQALTFYPDAWTEFLSGQFLLLWCLEDNTKVILNGIQGEERVLVHDELTKGPFLGFPVRREGGS